MEELDSSWRKSSYSDNGGNCVIVANTARTVMVKDTKDFSGGTLNVPATAWSEFLGKIK
jgi:hypothetical protein